MNEQRFRSLGHFHIVQPGRKAGELDPAFCRHGGYPALIRRYILRLDDLGNSGNGFVDHLGVFIAAAQVFQYLFDLGLLAGVSFEDTPGNDVIAIHIAFSDFVQAHFHRLILILIRDAGRQIHGQRSKAIRRLDRESKPDRQHGGQKPNQEPLPHNLTPHHCYAFCFRPAAYNAGV